MSSRKYFLPQNYLKAMLKFMNLALLSHFDRRRASNVDQSLRHPPIFIIGAPRSGSTLLTQVLTDAFDVGYMANAHCYLFGAPYLVENLFHPAQRKQKSNYSSLYGRTSNITDSAECGDYWYRFFRRNPAYVTLEDIEEKKMISFRRSLSALISSSDKPFLFKNLYASLRVLPICKYIPEAIFIIISRDEIDNAHSILRARKTLYGSYEKWFSVPPPAVEDLKNLPPEQQVVEQIRQIYQTIFSDFITSRIDARKLLVIKYEAFCHDVHGSLNEVESFFRDNDIKVSRRFSVPDQFQQVGEVKIDPALYKKLEEYVGTTKSHNATVFDRVNELRSANRIV